MWGKSRTLCTSRLPWHCVLMLTFITYSLVCVLFLNGNGHPKLDRRRESYRYLTSTQNCVLHMTLGFGSNNKQLLMLPLITATFAFCVHSEDSVWQCYFAIHNPMPTQKSFSMQNSMKIFYKLVVCFFFAGALQPKEIHIKSFEWMFGY